MICWTSFSSKTAWLQVFLLVALLWGCTGKNAEISGNDMTTGEDERQLTEDNVQEVLLPMGDNMLIAFLPLENLSGVDAPMDEIAAALGAGLTGKGFHLLDGLQLEEFRKKHRMRYVGGVSPPLAAAMLAEMGADAVLITSLEAYREGDPPQISLIARLVSCGPQPEIIWIDSVGLSGDESPGLLDLKRIRDPRVLVEKAVETLVNSLAKHFQTKTQIESMSFLFIPDSWKATGPGTLKATRYRMNRKYLPYDYFRSPLIDPDREYSIAVLPMLDLAVRKKAGIIAQLHYVRELFNATDFKVLEPGLVREALLRIRAIMPYGPSLAETDLITSTQILGVDLVLAGKVFDYQNTSRNPKVDFSMQIIEKNSRRVVFGTRTFNTGMDRVFFYNFGRVYTAHNLLREMSRVTVQLLTVPYHGWEEQEEFIVQCLPWNGVEYPRNYLSLVTDGGL